MYRLIISLLILSTPVFGQEIHEFAPIGAEWHYQILDWNNTLSGYELIRSERDTVIGDKSCKVLSRVEVRAWTELQRAPMIICQADNLIEHWIDDEFYTLYDFNAQVGDSWKVKLLDEVHESQFEDAKAIIRVDSISYKTVCDKQLKVLSVSLEYDDFDNEFHLLDWSIREIIVDLGSPDFIVPQINYDYPNSRELNCYTSESCLYKNSNIETSCRHIVGLMELNNNKIELYPNPASDYIYLSNLEQYVADIGIYTITGKLVLKLKGVKNGHPIDISKLKNGVYILRFFDEKMNRGNKMFSIIRG